MTADQGGPQWNLQMTLPTASHAVRMARQATRDALTTWRLAGLEENAVLLVSELVTNAVRHARGSDAITLELQAARTWLRIEVTDADPQWPRPRTPAGFDGSGFGFVLVDALAGKWGVRETATGKAVWAELDEGPQMSRGSSQASPPLNGTSTS
jgi:serine/threonine-protein kinase RsbW